MERKVEMLWAAVKGGRRAKNGPTWLTAVLRVRPPEGCDAVDHALRREQDEPVVEGGDLNWRLRPRVQLEHSGM